MRGWLAVAVACCCAPRLAHAGEPEANSGVQGGARPFELSAAEHLVGLGVSRTWARRTDRELYRPGYELRGSEVLRWTRGAAVVEGRFGASVRWGPGVLSGSLLHNGGMAGVHVGPLDLRAGVSSSLLNLRVSSGAWDFGFFWPRASLGVGLQLGPARLEALAHVEYAWGWLGPDEYVRGLGLVLSLQREPVGPEYGEPPASER